MWLTEPWAPHRLLASDQDSGDLHFIKEGKLKICSECLGGHWVESLPSRQEALGLTPSTEKTSCTTQLTEKH